MTMHAVVVYESMYGNTRQVADAIGSGLSSRFDVAVVPVSEAAQVARQLRAHGFAMAAPPESFLVTRQNRLVPDESERAREWAGKLAESITPTREPGISG